LLEEVKDCYHILSCFSISISKKYDNVCLFLDEVCHLHLPASEGLFLGEGLAETKILTVGIKRFKVKKPMRNQRSAEASSLGEFFEIPIIKFPQWESHNEIPIVKFHSGNPIMKFP
jgi:hypothetical protein